MRFRDRAQAGQLLAKKLKKCASRIVVVYAIPRGGVVTAVEIAKSLRAPLDLVITRKIGHPYNSEYAIAAIAENDHVVGTRRELASVDKNWLRKEIKKERLEIVRRRKEYLGGRKMMSPRGKIAILVDDGVATGLTLRVAVSEIKHRNPAKLIVAIPVVPKSAAKVLEKEINELVALEIPTDDEFLGAVGGYYEKFKQVEDGEVIEILNNYKVWLQAARSELDLQFEKKIA